MNVDNYPSNSNISKKDGKPADKSEDKKVEKVISGNAQLRKKSEARKLLDVFLPDDITNVREFFFNDIIVPGIKRAVYDMGISMLDGFFGEFGRNSRLGGPAKVAYHAIGSKLNDSRHSDPPTRRGTDYDEVILPTRVEAQQVLDGAEEILANYDYLTIHDLYELAGLNAPYTYRKYGWTDIRMAKVIPVRGGYMVKMPKAMPMD